MPQLSRYIDIATVGYSTATAGSVAEVDTQGCEGVLFIGVPGTTAARIWSMALKAGASTTGFVACGSTFTHASTASANDVIVTDVFKPAKRWIGATLTSSAQTPSWLIAVKYGVRTLTGNFAASGTNMPTASGGILRVVSPTSST